ncbi:transcriptional regulator, TetR family [Microbacterium sp. cf046]|uniref:TetR/AcrR family transcriptional regulator n=1 Tax=Microbacterium sp. cf046 TaxID=1761803 RepID=UPI0008E3B040|nr:TetR/AcrR family transcriptional regulator [Microbacterium sp. cf046]SFR88878.1 transcriptional regulator, TetR family [Microbacterium sp. cf046]
MPSPSTTPHPRVAMIEAAVRLLATHGYQATSFSSVLETSGAPRGSIYHHFPDGKDQLIAAAVEVAGGRAIALLDSLEGEEPAAVTVAFLQMWRALLVATDMRAGCSVLAVTVAAPTSGLLETAGAVFTAWRSRLAELFRAGGAEATDAGAFAALLIAASEGAVAIARAERSIRSFDTVAEDLRRRAVGLRA